MLKDGDKIRIGRDLIAVLGVDTSQVAEDDDIRRTLAPGEDTRFPSLIGQLVEKSLRAGKIKDAERYALALSSQLVGARVPVTHPAADACNRCLIQLADKTSSGVWIDRLFKLYAAQSWVMANDTVESIRTALDRIPRVPGTGMRDYEQLLRQLAKEGTARARPSSCGRSPSSPTPTRAAEGGQPGPSLGGRRGQDARAAVSSSSSTISISGITRPRRSSLDAKPRALTGSGLAGRGLDGAPGLGMDMGPGVAQAAVNGKLTRVRAPAVTPAGALAANGPLRAPSSSP